MASVRADANHLGAPDGTPNVTFISQVYYVDADHVSQAVVQAQKAGFTPAL